MDVLLVPMAELLVAAASAATEALASGGVRRRRLLRGSSVDIDGTGVVGGAREARSASGETAVVAVPPAEVM
jgi:hypothetical protein